jgi:hypothetical protein
MAKRRPTLALLEMENELGYKVDSSSQLTETVKRFYSDLKPVPDGTFEKTKREFEEYERMRYKQNNEQFSVRKVLTLAGATVSMSLIVAFIELK